MKKILALALVLVLALGTVGCGGDGTTRVELTDENWQEYFIINYEGDVNNLFYREKVIGKDFWGRSTITVTVKLKKGIRLEDVTFNVELVDLSEGAKWGDLSFIISMPANGDTTTASKSTNTVSASNPSPHNPRLNYSRRVHVVSGYVIVDSDSLQQDSVAKKND